MRNLNASLFISTLAMLFVIVGCGNNAEKEALALKMKQDSIMQAEQTARIKARADSLAQVMEQEKMQMQDNEDQNTSSEFDLLLGDESGSMEIQVEAWRSQEHASERLKFWKSEGYENAFVVQTGKEATGDIWYRIRLMKARPEQVQGILARLTDMYKVKTWVVE